MDTIVTTITTVVAEELLRYTIHQPRRIEGSSVDIDLEEHLRQQPVHLGVADNNVQVVAFVKQKGKGFGKQWYRISCVGPCLAVDTESTISMGWKKRFGEARDMKIAWIRLQTGQLPLLATEKGKWNKLPLAEASPAGSWLQLSRLLGTVSPFLVGEQAFVAVPVAVLFALLATAASRSKTLSLKLQPVHGFNTMKLDNIPEDMDVDFSRTLNAGVTFAVRSCWRFAALLDSFDSQG